MTRFNKLLNVIRDSLKEILKALKGLALLSTQLEEAFFNIFDGKTPIMWIAASYPSLKPLSGYVTNLLERLQFFQRWIDKGKPALFWISGIYFTQAFTTGASQNFARRYKIPIDTLAFEFTYPREQTPETPPEDGVYTYGLFFEAARWNEETWTIDESLPKVLFCNAPMIWIQVEQLKTAPIAHLRIFWIFQLLLDRRGRRRGWSLLDFQTTPALPQL